MSSEQTAYPKWKIKFRASKDEDLLSAMAALSKLQESQANRPPKPKKPAKKKVKKHRHKKDGAAEMEVTEDFMYDWPRCVCGMNHPPVPFFKKPDLQRCTYYWQVADMFPFMTIHRVLTTEIKFIGADKDQSGVIELCEMKELMESVMAEEYNEKNVKKMFKQIDTDESGTLDFTEVLTVIDGIIQRRSVNLPTQVKNEVSKTCVIQ